MLAPSTTACSPIFAMTRPFRCWSGGASVVGYLRFVCDRYRRGVHQTRERLAAASLYLCTDARRERGDLAEFAEAALAGGVDIIQLRDKGSPGERQFGPLEARGELEALATLADAARRHDALLAVNDRADIALAAGADVLHLGQDDLPIAVARGILGAGPLVGRSTHDHAQVRSAVAESAQKAPTISASDRAGQRRQNPAVRRRASTSSGQRPNWQRRSHGSRSAELTINDFPKYSRPALRRIVVVRAITAADDPCAAAQQLKQLLRAVG